MIRFLFTCIFLSGLTSRAAFCQNECNCNGNDKLTTEPEISGELFSPASQPDIITYFNREWLSGDIFLMNGGIIKDRKIRYNGFLDELMLLEPESNQAIILDKEAILKFHILNFQGDTSVYFRKLKVKRDILNDSIEIFGQVLYQGKLSLFVFHSFYFDRSEIVQMNKRYYLKDIYKEDPIYYITFSDNETVGFKNFNRKNIYALMPVQKEQIKKFLNENNPGRIDTYHEIISVIQFLDSILNR